VLLSNNTASFDISGIVNVVDNPVLTSDPSVVISFVEAKHSLVTGTSALDGCSVFVSWAVAAVSVIISERFRLCRFRLVLAVVCLVVTDGVSILSGMIVS
jgi:hypothetical protein